MGNGLTGRLLGALGRRGAVTAPQETLPGRVLTGAGAGAGAGLGSDRLTVKARLPEIALVRDGKEVVLPECPSPQVFDGTPHLRKAWEVLQEPAFQAYLRKQQERTGQDIRIRLVDDRGDVPDTWPHASGHTISIGESYFTGLVGRAKGRKAGIRNLLAHEIAHTQDRAPGEPKAYGPDGKHKTHEIIRKSAAMSEGWANYQGLRWDPLRRHLLVPIEAASWTRVVEDPARPGKYRWHPINSFDDHMGNEMVVARVLGRLERELPDGAARIDRAFDATNDGSLRSLESLLSRLAADNPADARRIILGVDASTGFSASEDQLRKVFGPAADDYLSPGRRFARSVGRVPIVGWIVGLWTRRPSGV